MKKCLSDEDHALSNNSYFGSNMENDDIQNRLKFGYNCVAFMFDEIPYEFSGMETVVKTLE